MERIVTIETTAATARHERHPRIATMRKLRALGYPPSMRRKWWNATNYLRDRGLWVLDGAPARWGRIGRATHSAHDAA
jgi:hypothetical protein